jgi:hypothetical protein
MRRGATKTAVRIASTRFRLRPGSNHGTGIRFVFAHLRSVALVLPEGVYD